MAKQAKEKAPVVLTGDYGLVFYTDGGCRPSRGCGGWGVHGYLYNTDESKRGSGCKQGQPGVKGYHRGEKKKELTLIKYIDGSGSTSKASTNNEAELTGMIKAMEKALEIYAEQPLSQVTFLSDSKYVLDGLTSWVNGWRDNGWKKSDGSDIINVELWKMIVDLTESCRTTFPKVEWEWIKGHSGNAGNEASDKLATMGVIATIKGIPHETWDESDPQGYWSSSVTYNRLMTHPRWYFNTNEQGHIHEPTGRHIYYFGDHGKRDEWLGKRQADSSFSILHVKEPIAILDGIREYQNAIARSSTTQSVIAARLDNILQSDNLAHLTKYGTKFIYHNTKGGMNIVLPFGKSADADDGSQTDIPLTREITPPRLAWMAVETLGSLDEVLRAYIEKSDVVKLTTMNITDILYDVDATKKQPVYKLKSTLNSLAKTIEVDVAYDTGAQQGSAKVMLTVGLDTAKRNELSALASRSPKVTVVSWREADRAFRYATIIEADDDIGLYCGAYSNIRVLV